MHQLIAPFSALLLVLTFSESIAVAQCCLGAQNSVSMSANRRYRVEATSLTGVGHRNHGPYKFRFRTSRVNANGQREELGEFERAWDNTNHFSMRIFVSPTGNGFALSTSLEEAVHFFAPDGDLLASIDGNQHQVILELSDDFKNSDNEFRLRARTQLGERSTKLWLPLLHVTGPETKWLSRERPRHLVKKDIAITTVTTEEYRWLVRMLEWRPQVGMEEQEHVKKLVAESHEAALVDYGLSSLDIIENSLAEQEQVHLRRARKEIMRRLAGHRDAWKNLDLLLALLEHPNPSLRTCALDQLRLLVPHGKPTVDWIQQNRPSLRWNKTSNTYTRAR